MILFFFIATPWARKSGRENSWVSTKLFWVPKVSLFDKAKQSKETVWILSRIFGSTYPGDEGAITGIITIDHSGVS